MTAAKRPAPKRAKAGKATQPKARKGAVKKSAAKKAGAVKRPATVKKSAVAPAGRSSKNRSSVGKAGATRKAAAAKAKSTSTRTTVARTAPTKVPAAPKVKARPPVVIATRTGKTARTARRIPAPNPLEPTESDTLIHGIPPYRPKSGEPYMSPKQLEHFRNILTSWKRELMEEVDRTVHHMQDEASNFPDPNDRATQESEFGLELRTRDRERKLLKKINAALERIEDRSYGFCEETGDEIGLRRLEARPVATLSLEAQERREMTERQYGERDDRYR